MRQRPGRDGCRRRAESVRECDRAVELSPFDSGLLACRCWHALYANDYGKTIEDARRAALTCQPDDGWSSLVLGWAYERACSRSRSPPCEGLQLQPQEVLHRAHVFSRQGNRPAAEKILDEMLAAAKTKYAASPPSRTCCAGWACAARLA